MEMKIQALLDVNARIAANELVSDINVFLHNGSNIFGTLEEVDEQAEFIVITKETAGQLIGSVQNPSTFQDVFIDVEDISYIETDRTKETEE
jgi:sRNA-binding regulator protein Hfq